MSDDDRQRERQRETAADRNRGEGVGRGGGERRGEGRGGQARRGATEQSSRGADSTDDRDDDERHVGGGDKLGEAEGVGGELTEEAEEWLKSHSSQAGYQKKQKFVYKCLSAYWYVCVRILGLFFFK